MLFFSYAVTLRTLSTDPTAISASTAKKNHGCHLRNRWRGAAACVLEMDYRLHVCHVKRRKHKTLTKYAERTLESCSSVCRSHVTILTVMQVYRFYEMCPGTVNNPGQLHPENPVNSLPDKGSKNLSRTQGCVLFSSFLVTLIVLVRF